MNEEEEMQEVQEKRETAKGAYQMELVKRLSFLRYAGTEDEERAAAILEAEIEKAGGTWEAMEFPIPAYRCDACAVQVTAPFQRAIRAVPYGCSGEIPEDAPPLQFYYAARGVEEDYVGMESLEGYAVLINSFSYDAYQLLCDKKASAFLVMTGKWYDTEETLDMPPRQLREKMLAMGKVPGFVISARDATEMVRDGAEKVKLTLREEEYEATSQNVLAIIPGTSMPEESIVITAHYDSVLVGTGAWDNATGSATIMALYRHFLQNPPRRTLRFIWCGAEEQGLLGSKAYIARHEALMEEIRFCFNFDMCGTILGPNRIFVTGGDDLKLFAEQYCHETGWSADIKVAVHSSDSAPFADRGIPALGLGRRSETAVIHTRYDQLFPLCAEKLGDMEDFATGLIGRVANAVILPVAPGMPDSMKEELDKYFHRDKEKAREKKLEKERNLQEEREKAQEKGR